MTPPRLLLTAVALSACSAGGGSQPPPGFSVAFAPDLSDGGGAIALHAIDGTGAGNSWAVGEGGATVAQAGGPYVLVLGPAATPRLGGLSAADVAHVYAVEVGGDAVVTFDGTKWVPLGAPRAGRAAAATWASSPKDVWVAGNGIEHWDGTAWTQAVPAGTTFTGLSGSFDTDVWAVGPGGAYHWDGHAWGPVVLPSGTPALAAAWSSSLFDTWMVGAAGTVLHWNGTAITFIPSGTTADLTCVSGTSVADVWVGGKEGTLLHWNGSAFVTHAASSADGGATGAPTIEDLWTAPGAAVLFVDGSGAIRRYVY